VITGTGLPPDHRLLLDQGYPKPPGFAVPSVDKTVAVQHLSDFDPALAQNSTPDWMLYCVAKERGFDGVVTRDRSQLDQAEEMFVLSRLEAFAVITWRKPIEDPIREWGQLLAYLPEIKKRLGGGAAKAVLLPEPSLSTQNLVQPREAIGIEASRRGVSNHQVRQDAQAAIEDWLEMEDQAGRFDRLLGI
jgi:hypothetical protein